MYSSSQARKHDDWWCSTCSFKIYGHKDRCGKCGSSRQDQELVEAEAAARAAERKKRLAKAQADKAKVEEAAKFSHSLDPSKDSKVDEEEVATMGCIVCWERKKAVTFVPCGHFSTCRICADSILKALDKKCPMCRGEVGMAIETFG